MRFIRVLTTQKSSSTKVKTVCKMEPKCRENVAFCSFCSGEIHCSHPHLQVVPETNLIIYPLCLIWNLTLCPQDDERVSKSMFEQEISPSTSDQGNLITLTPVFK